MAEKMWIVRAGERAVLVQEFEDKNYGAYGDAPVFMRFY
jgi:hypothetical protein